jgi:hypothetical protein
LANAWRVVLSDPNYKERRPFEERKHTAEEQALTLGEAARETSQSRGTEKRLMADRVNCATKC